MPSKPILYLLAFVLALTGCHRSSVKPDRHVTVSMKKYAITPSEIRLREGETIQGLPASFRTVFVLRDVEGLSTEETAEMLGLSVPAVKSRLLRARLQLRERLNRYFKKNKNGDTKQ
jgi:DNA-directed RNA polymerase specialized sigma24 family protein